MLLQHYSNHATFKMREQKENIPHAEETGAASLGTLRMGMLVWLCPFGPLQGRQQPQDGSQTQMHSWGKTSWSALHKLTLKVLY